MPVCYWCIRTLRREGIIHLERAVELCQGLEKTRIQKYAFGPQAIGLGMLGKVRLDIRTLKFCPSEQTANGVVQRYEFWNGEFPPPALPAIALLGALLTQSAQAAGYLWNPNEVAVQRYPKGKVGIGPHKDSKRRQQLVIIVCVEGEAEFTLYEPDRVTVIERRLCGTGDVVILRGPDGNNDDRPVHSVSGGRNTIRISLAYRMFVPSVRADISLTNTRRPETL